MHWSDSECPIRITKMVLLHMTKRTNVTLQHVIITSLCPVFIVYFNGLCD